MQSDMNIGVVLLLFSREVLTSASRVARFVYLELIAIEEVRKGICHQLIQPSHLISGKEETANKFVHGSYIIA